MSLITFSKFSILLFFSEILLLIFILKVPSSKPISLSPLSLLIIFSFSFSNWLLISNKFLFIFSNSIFFCFKLVISELQLSLWSLLSNLNWQIANCFSSSLIFFFKFLFSSIILLDEFDIMLTLFWFFIKSVCCCKRSFLSFITIWKFLSDLSIVSFNSLYLFCNMSYFSCNSFNWFLNCVSVKLLSFISSFCNLEIILLYSLFFCIKLFIFWYNIFSFFCLSNIIFWLFSFRLLICSLKLLITVNTWLLLPLLIVFGIDSSLKSSSSISSCSIFWLLTLLFLYFMLGSLFTLLFFLNILLILLCFTFNIFFIFIISSFNSFILIFLFSKSLNDKFLKYSNSFSSSSISINSQFWSSNKFWFSIFISFCSLIKSDISRFIILFFSLSSLFVFNKILFIFNNFLLFISSLKDWVLFIFILE